MSKNQRRVAAIFVPAVTIVMVSDPRVEETFACNPVAGGWSSELPPRASPLPALPTRSSCAASFSRKRSNAGLQAWARLQRAVFMPTIPADRLLSRFVSVAPPPSNDAASTPRYPKMPFGVLVPPSPSCSALTVSHRLGSLLRCFACKSVSPCSGLGVHDVSGVPSHPPPKRRGQADHSSRARTRRSVSSPAAVPCHHGHIHLDVAPGDS